MADKFDANDETRTVYAVVYDNDQPVSTGQFLAETKIEARLTRIATLADYRGQGYGAKVIEALETYARQEGFRQLTIHSELTAQTFYENLGYQTYGPKCLEDGEYCQSILKWEKNMDIAMLIAIVGGLLGCYLYLTKNN
ncbi:GNAT family N-acetyltransferase [Streptococcus pyogenes]|uniref:GNAT family N-acetyltransferase n=1 Tax=Streptococcus pyogenes TaxID=1314 RepID=UPI00109D4468|nr:GNAT family N-acetyltransferase [Streptococcus pyogenes]VGQ29707.1 acetyltransferase [Streptococcus pyogenes]VHC01325.1 acetyltransferase [Streptococcus pyogenes]VHC91540.1 acetyltransferase [Streptococcus pyogenes]